MTSGRARQCGVTYLLVLFAVAALGLGLAKLGTVWSVAVQREREAELLFIGGEFARAIVRYRADTPAGVAESPTDLAQLLLDPRFPGIRRHLRKLYRDPMTGSTDWIVERAGGRITGVRSRSTRLALRSANLPSWVSIGAASERDVRYTDWLFRLEDPSDATPAPGVLPSLVRPP
jgi:type II secretory pathway pseudopilin PulG